jgi:hypothetical protein
MSIFGRGNYNGEVSVLDTINLGSNLSVQLFSRARSSLSVFGEGRFGNRVSILDIFTCGSSLSVASFGRLGSGAYLFEGLCLDW